MRFFYVPNCVKCASILVDALQKEKPMPWKNNILIEQLILNDGIISFLDKDTVEEFHKKYHVQGLPYSIDNFFS